MAFFAWKTAVFLETHPRGLLYSSHNMTFFESLEQAISVKGGPLCVGIDPRIEPQKDSFDRLLDYGRRVVDACAPYAVAFKPQLAFFERHGASGYEALNTIIEHIREIDPHYPIILDAKRGDIGSTAEAYAQALLDREGSLAVTLSPYLGADSIRPFLNYEKASVFVLCRTTNPSAEKIQERHLDDGTPLYLAVADEALSWDSCTDKSRIGLVVAGNNVHALRAVRERHPDAWFLAPGVGAQGGMAKDLIEGGARSDGLGIIASASRSVADAENPRNAAMKVRDALNHSRETRRTGRTRLPQMFSKEESREMFLKPSETLELLEGLFHIGAFKTGKFILKSGIESPFYIDLRRISADARLLELSGRAYKSVLQNIDYDHIAGIPMAALPLATATALATKKSLIYPRIEKKNHGSGVRVEGRWQQGERVVMLDDLITTGGSKKEAAIVLREAGLVVEDLVVLIERGSHGRVDMENIAVKLHSWACIEDILQVGLDAGLLEEKVADSVREFVAS